MTAAATYPYDFLVVGAGLFGSCLDLLDVETKIKFFKLPDLIQEIVRVITWTF